MSSIRKVHALIELGRPKFLIGGFVLYALGAAAAVYDGAAFGINGYIWGQLAVTAAQLMTHYSNDYFDLRADSANQTPTNWSGGSRVLVEGRLPKRVALYAALVLAALSFAVNARISTAIQPGVLPFLVMAAGLVLAWFYSAPPLRLHSTGFGELTTALVVTGLTPLTGYVVQTGVIGAPLLLACLPLCCLQVAMLLAVEFPDAEGDMAVGKRTLVVRIGRRAGARLYAALLLAAFALLPILVLAGLPVEVAAAGAATLPLAAWLLLRIARGDWREPARWNRLAFLTIALLVAMAAAQACGFVLLALSGRDPLIVLV